MYMIVYFVNEILGMYFKNIALLSLSGILTLCFMNELFISKITKNSVKIRLYVLLLVIISIILYFGQVYLYGGYVRPYSVPDNYGCVKGVGYPCAVPEDKGKVTASKTKEAIALMKKYGRENVIYKALEIHLAHDHAYLKQLNPHFRDEVGCIIVVQAGNEGYVMQEEKSLKVVRIETLDQFQENTNQATPAVLQQFYNALH